MFAHERDEEEIDEGNVQFGPVKGKVRKIEFSKQQNHNNGEIALPANKQVSLNGYISYGPISLHPLMPV